MVGHEINRGTRRPRTKVVAAPVTKEDSQKGAPNVEEGSEMIR